MVCNFDENKIKIPATDRREYIGTVYIGTYCIMLFLYYLLHVQREHTE